MNKIIGPLLIAIQALALGSCGSEGVTPADAPDTTSDAPTKDPKILNDAHALDSKYGIAATIRCGADADDYLRSVAKYAFKWDEMGMLDAKFDRFQEHLHAPGVLTEVSNKAALQNGFGAYQRITLYCWYDTQAQKVLGYAVDNPIFPADQ